MSAKNQNLHSHLVYCNQFPFRRKNGIVSQWISSLVIKSLGKDCIYVVVDKLTKFSHFFAITSSFSATQVADIFFKEIFRLHGLPKSIVSDRDSRFMGDFWQENFMLVGTQLTPSTTYHPKTNRKIDRVNQWLEGYLKNYVGEKQKAWTKWLHLG